MILRIGSDIVWYSSVLIYYGRQHGRALRLRVIDHKLIPHIRFFQISVIKSKHLLSLVTVLTLSRLQIGHGNILVGSA